MITALKMLRQISREPTKDNDHKDELGETRAISLIEDTHALTTRVRVGAIRDLRHGRLPRSSVYLRMASYYIISGTLAAPMDKRSR